MSWRSVSAFDGGDNAAPAHIGPHLSRQWATHCTFGQPLRTFHSCRSAHEDNTGRRTAQKSALDVGEPATQCTGEGGRAVHGQGERRAHQFLHLALCSARWLLGHPPYFASRCKAGSLMCQTQTTNRTRSWLCGAKSRRMRGHMLRLLPAKRAHDRGLFTGSVHGRARGHCGVTLLTKS